MRWKYIIPRCLIVLALWTFLKFGLDPVLRTTAVTTAQAVIGARADIESLSTEFFPPRLNMHSVALADAGRPGKNLLEFEELHLSLAGKPLLRRQFVVNEGRITGVRFGTDRGDDGRLPQQDVPTSDEPSWLSEQLTELGTQWLANLSDQAEQMLDPNQLETYRVGNEVYAKWDDRFAELVVQTQNLEPDCSDCSNSSMPPIVRLRSTGLNATWPSQETRIS